MKTDGRKSNTLEQLYTEEKTLKPDTVSKSGQVYAENERYRQLFHKLVDEEEQLHLANQKRIKAGIQCLIWIPMVFMLLLFLTDGEKVIFLVLWIVSLFAIAGYLIYIEYIDFQAQERLREYQDDEDGLNTSLIGEDIEAFEETVVQLLRQIDQKKTVNREKRLKLFDGERKEVNHE